MERVSARSFSARFPRKWIGTRLALHRDDLTGHGTRGNVEGDTGDLDPIPGTWLFDLELKKATGRYRVNWHAR